MNIKVLLGFTLSVLNLISFSQLKKKVLFIGNSYTYVNNLPQLIKDIALSKTDTLEFDQSTPGGYSFQNHCLNAVTWTKIRSQNWDAVVLQAQSQEPSFKPVDVMTGTYPYAKQLCDSIKVINPCTEIIFYMTWGRKNGDASNCSYFAPLCTYNGMQARLRESYMLFKDSFKTSVAPVGVAWKTVRQVLPAVNLYQPDDSHPSVEGSYLAACVFYSNIFNKTAVGSNYISTLSSTLAASLQYYGSHTVLDSSLNWSLGSNLPLADFNYSLTSGNSFQFINQSLHSNTYLWSFGSTAKNPVYTFTNSGLYTVKLKATNSCKSDSITKSITITSNLNYNSNLNIKVYFDEQKLIVSGISGELIDLYLYSLDGKLLMKYNKININSSLYTPNLPNGIYHITINSNNFIKTYKTILNY